MNVAPSTSTWVLATLPHEDATEAVTVYIPADSPVKLATPSAPVTCDVPPGCSRTVAPDTGEPVSESTTVPDNVGGSPTVMTAEETSLCRPEPSTPAAKNC